MAKQLYAYSITPGDTGHIPAYEVSEGVVEAEPDEIAAILAELGEAHRYEVSIRPVEEAKVDLAKLRIDLGGGLTTYHDGDHHGGPVCEADRPYIEAYNVDMWGDPAGAGGEEDEYEGAE